MTKSRDLKEACVAEALAILVAEGIEKLSLREVSRRLNVSHQAPYRHFPSRDHLLAEIVARAFRDFASALDESAHIDDAELALTAMGMTYLNYAKREPLAYRLMFQTPLPSPEVHPEMMLEARHAFDLLRRALQRISNDGHPEKKKANKRPGNDLITRNALFLWSTLHGFASIQSSSAVETLALPNSLMEAMIPYLFMCMRSGINLGPFPAAHTEFFNSLSMWPAP